MRIANGWKQYRILDTSQLEKLESWHGVTLVRPDPQIIWKSEKKDPRWRSAHARYKRSSTGGGKWEVYKKLPDVWKITRGDLTFRLKPMGFNRKVSSLYLILQTSGTFFSVSQYPPPLFER